MFRTLYHTPAMLMLISTSVLGVGLTPAPSSAAGIAIDSVLGLDHPDCCHVIDLLMHNRIRRSFTRGIPASQDDPASRLMGIPQPGDLELLEVNLVSDGDATCGPAYQVSFRNTSNCPVYDFRISIVGVLCRIEPISPCTMMTIPCIQAGETKCVQIQLPARVMTMGPSGAQPAAFDTLVVALDSCDEIVECDELNNVAILKRAEVGLLAAETPVAPVAEPGAAAPAEPAPEDNAVPTPDDKANPSPLDKIDLDELDLDDAEGSALRTALEIM